jgi:hypothetical protein
MNVDKPYGRFMMCGTGYGDVNEQEYAELEALVADSGEE